MEQKYHAPVDSVFELLTDPKWLESRCLKLGELSARVKVKKSGRSVSIAMTRRVRRELPALVAKVLSAESDLEFEETWKSDGDGGYVGVLSMDIVGQPVTMTAEFSLTPAGKGCMYRIAHVARCGIPLVGRHVAKFAQEQIEAGCTKEFAYLVNQLKMRRLEFV